MIKPKKPTPIEILLADGSAPIEQRREFLKMLLNDPSPDAGAAVQSIFNTLTSNGAAQVYEEKARELASILKQIEDGPLRSAAFIEMLPKNGFAARQAHVVLDDGTTACTVVPEAAMAENLRRGDRVLLDGRGKAVLHRLPGGPRTGEEALFERRLDDRHIELTIRGQDRYVFLAAQDLADQLAREEVKPGAALIVNARHGMAYEALPPADGLAHYKYLVREQVPSVDVQRDIGCPPPCIADALEHIRIEMTDPGLSREFGVRRCQMRLLAGVSGSGKTLAIQAICAGAYQVMSEVTGTPVEALPPRTFRLRMSEVLNYLLGESDKQLGRFFQEVEQLAEERFTNAAGQTFTLPVIAILEEIDGLARARGGHDTVYDRILTTALQWLDATRPELKNKLILYLGTTNEPDQVDRAFLRRIGTNIDHFRRLQRKGFASVLDKHLHKVPVALRGQDEAEATRRQLIREIVDWLFSPNGSDRGIVELTFAGSTTPVVRHRRDLLTGALVDRAVQDAAKAARREQLRTRVSGGITAELLTHAFEQQFRALVEQLTELNVRQYVDVPDGVRVATLRRLAQPSLLPQQLQRP
ncbi:MAG TPA: AAA family ATPase [Verrucomicrobiae bacterium]|nr:AAA family ATPase [Verrucomicrobiae bacterium]